MAVETEDDPAATLQTHRRAGRRKRQQEEQHDKILSLQLLYERRMQPFTILHWRPASSGVLTGTQGARFHCHNAKNTRMMCIKHSEQTMAGWPS